MSIEEMCPSHFHFDNNSSENVRKLRILQHMIQLSYALKFKTIS